MQIAPESHAVYMALVLVLSLAGNSYYGLYYFTFDRFMVKQEFFFRVLFPVIFYST